MKLKIFTIILIVGAIALAVYSAIKKDAFKPAEDFPRNALVYVQIDDLPAFIALLNESTIKENYTTSENFADFQNSHLGKKLVNRLEEFSTASGFSIDLNIISNLTENRASFALYDIGKLEFVFIAPINDEIFAATKFVQNRTNFTEEFLEDATKIYRATIEADRGRQKQELIFTKVKGRFILATSEKLLVQTLSNINGKGAKNRLTDEPSFANLSNKMETHLATIWVNQTALNADYYFKRYWLMSAPDNLQNIRAGMFDFEIQETKLIERRKFLLNKNINISPIPASQVEKLLTFLPAEIPFYRLQKADSNIIHEMIEQTIFDRKEKETPLRKRRNFYNSSFYNFDDYSSSDYEYLSETFDENINETQDDETIERRETTVDFSETLKSANPQAVLSFGKPKLSPAPLFIKFKRGTIFHLASVAGFNQTEFEAKIVQKFVAQTMISSPNIMLNWETKTENNLTWRELKLPMLEWKAVYVLRGNYLILANDSEFLREIVSAENVQTVGNTTFPFTKLTVVNLAEKENTYTKIFNRLEEKDAADVFFTGNIESLLDSISEIKKIEIRENYAQNILEEELIFFR